MNDNSISSASVNKAVSTVLLDKPNIHKINSRSIEPYSPDLENQIKRIISIYNTTKKHKVDACYKEVDLPNKFNLNRYKTVRFYYAMPSMAPNSLAKLLKKIGSTVDFSTKTLHFLLFLGNEDNELYALTTNHSWNVIKSYCDYSFSFAVAKRLSQPIFAYAETKPIVGNIISETEAFKDEYQAFEFQLRNIWRLFKNFSTSFKEDSSIFLLDAFAKYRDQKVALAFGVWRISLGVRLTLPHICETLDHFSTISKGGITTKVNGLTESDDPHFRFLDFIQPVKGGIHTKLGEELLDQVWQFYTKKINTIDVFFCHRYSIDFCRSTEFLLTCERNNGSILEKFWYYPPTLSDVISFLQDSLPNLDKKDFIDHLNKITMKYNGKNTSYKLREFFQGEIRGAEGSYFKVEGIWYEVKADYLIIMQNHFYCLLKNHLIAKGKPGHLDHIWYRKKEWTSFTEEEAKSKCSPAHAHKIPKHLETLATSMFVIIDDNGNVKYPCVLPNLFEDADQSIEKKRADLEYLLQNESQITEKKLKKLGFNKPSDIIALLKKPRAVLLNITQGKQKRWIVQGPIPDNSFLKDFLTTKHEKYLQVGKEEFYNRSYLEKQGFLVGDQVYGSEKQKAELWDLLYHGNPDCLYLYHVKSGFKQQTRDACSQIRVAAQSLRSDLASTNPLLKKMYANATKKDSDSIFRKKVSETYQQFSEDEFVNLFRGKPRYEPGKEQGIIFVYAVLDDSGTERLLEDEQDIDLAFKRNDFSSFTNVVIASLKSAGYLTADLKITAKVLTCTQEEFCDDDNVQCNKAEKEQLYKVLSQRNTKFHSVIAKLELINLKAEMENWGFGFKIVQIRRGQEQDFGESVSAARFNPNEGNTQLQSSINDFFRPSTQNDLNLSLLTSATQLAITQASQKRITTGSLPNLSPTKKRKNDSPPPTGRISELFKKYKSKSTKDCRGINNPRFDCFLISAFQLLIHSDFFPILRNKDKFISQTTSQNGGWFDAFDKFSREYFNETSTGDLSITHFRDILQFPKNTQEDAQEAIQKILQLYDQTSFTSEVNYVRKIQKEFSTSLNRLNSDKQYSQLDNDGCSKTPAKHVTLEIPLKTGTFQSLLTLYFGKKDLETNFIFSDEDDQLFQTDSFEESCEATKLNESLLVTILRFDRDTKLDDQVDFEDGLCKIGDVQYRLHSYITHIGSNKKSGHYVTTCRIADTCKIFDDRKVTDIDEEQFLQGAKNAYVVILKKYTLEQGVPQSNVPE